MWRTLRTSTANCATERQLRSVWTTTFARLRWTKISPGSRPTIWFAGTRLSEQPIQRYSGDCWVESLEKNSGSDACILADHARLFANRFVSDFVTRGKVRESGGAGRAENHGNSAPARASHRGLGRCPIMP